MGLLQHVAHRSASSVLHLLSDVPTSSSSHAVRAKDAEPQLLAPLMSTCRAAVEGMVEVLAGEPGAEGVLRAMGLSNSPSIPDPRPLLRRLFNTRSDRHTKRA